MFDKKTVFVYTDEGVGMRAKREVPESLAELVVPKGLRVATIDAMQIREGQWEEESRLLVIPGGADRPYHAKLSGSGNQRIREYIERGGSYLGLCAGGYYGASTIEFDVGLTSEICESRELKFFPGVARGPAYGAGTYNPWNPMGGKAAPLVLPDGSTFSTYYNGGCIFLDSEKYPSVETLAHYEELEGLPAAAVLCHVDKGCAILTGVHPEYRLSSLFFPPLRAALKNFEVFRVSFMKFLLEKLGV